jgi:hypothetical protein
MNNTENSINKVSIDPIEKINNLGVQDKTKSIENYELPIGVKDTLFVLARNPSKYKDGINNMVSKMVAIKEFQYINLNDFSRILG